MRGGVLAAAAAYVIWGLFPLYFRLLQSVAPVEVLAHRVLWSLLLVAVVLVLLKRTAWLRPALRERAVLGRFVASAALIAVNWGVYLWAVNQGRILEASLGYFITPLANVLTGTLVLHEVLRPLQKAAVVVAAAGVAWLTWATGSAPWIALTLAASFSTYGLLRKTAPLGALEGLSLETLLLAPVAAGWLAWAAWQGQAAFPVATPLEQWLLIGTGPVTAIPLLLFASGVRRIPLSVLGMLQYLGPSIQFGLGLWLFGETFSGARAQGFLVIWAACVLFTFDLWRATRRTASALDGGAPA
jgi:chloramphenicol-sensitive protein RarD